LTVFRNGVWYIKKSSDGLAQYVNWGIGSDKLVPADYNGDGKTDAAVFRNGTWWIHESGGGATITENYGAASDTAAAGFNVQ
jgi:hypothetical protein